MKQSEYIPISQRENIKDQDIAKTVDYLERHAGNLKNITYSYVCDFAFLLDDYILLFDEWKVGIFTIEENNDWIDTDKEIITIPTHILAENIVWIYGSLKNIQ